MTTKNYSARGYNSGMGYEGRKDGLSLNAAKRHASKVQRDGGYGWTGEVLDETGRVVFARGHGARTFREI